MDRTEKFDNCERYIGRLYPADPNLIFFGGLAPEDQLSYDYSRDPRTKRYRSHTETVTLANRELQKVNSCLRKPFCTLLPEVGRDGANAEFYQ